MPALQNKIASTGKGILAMDESNATCGKRLESIGLENTVENRQVGPALRCLPCGCKDGLPFAHPARCHA